MTKQSFHDISENVLNSTWGLCFVSALIRQSSRTGTDSVVSPELQILVLTLDNSHRRPELQVSFAE